METPTFVGILPAAGLGSRLRPLRCPKELLPIAFVEDPLNGGLKPMLAVEYSLQAMHEAGVEKCIIVVSDRKSEILRYLGDGSEAGVSIAYVTQVEPLGLAAAVDTARHWLSGFHVCFALPDTVFSPLQAVRRVKEAILQTSADVVLGVFPTANPHDLGPVRVAESGRVIQVLEKPTVTDIYNTWGVAVWSPRFTEFLHRPPAELTNLSLSHIFSGAIRSGLDVRAVSFEAGSYTDLGTGENLAALLFGAWREVDEGQATLVSHARLSSVG